MFVRLDQALFKAFKSPISLQIKPGERWAVVGPKKRNLLQILAGKETAKPPTALSFPSLGVEGWPSQAIAHVAFGESGPKAPYIAARYESFRDEFDYTLRENLLRYTKNNDTAYDHKYFDKICADLKLENLLDNWDVTLSNGQTRRAILARALLKKPKALIIDEPFLGLDPSGRKMMADILFNLDIPVVIGAQSAAGIPEWTSHLAIAMPDQVQAGTVDEMQYKDAVATNRPSRDSIEFGEKVVELKNITVNYKGGPPVLENINLVARAGERVHVKGHNGSGKSTLLALITADHPKSWSESVVLFGKPRQVGKDSYFSIQSSIGHTSPEIHSIFPKHLTLNQALATAFGIGNMVPKVSAEQQKRINTIAEYLQLDLNAKFGESSLADQKLALYARALCKNPKILILDEAFSTLSLAQIERAFDLLDEYKGCTLIVGHVDSEIPAVDQVLDLNR